MHTRPRPRWPSTWIAPLVVVTVGLVLLLAGCGPSRSGYVEDTYPVTPGHIKHQAVIGHGRLGASVWTMRASVDAEGQLCMGVRWTPSAGPQEYGCGFGSNQNNDEGRMTEPVDSATSTDGKVLVYGPSPATAVRAVLTLPHIPGTDCQPSLMRPTTIIIRHTLPDWYPNHGASWFTSPLPAATADCVIDVRFVDSHHRTVAQPHNF